MMRFVGPDPSAVGGVVSRVVVGPSTIAAHASSRGVLERCLQMQRGLAADPWTQHVIACYQRGLEVAGSSWSYMDLLSVLMAAAELGVPETYLEIGVRRGRSLAAVVSAAPDVAIFGFDLWEAGYAGNVNDGPETASREAVRLGHRGPRTFVAGDSGRTVPTFLSEHPTLSLDLVCVDGDHSRLGAWADLVNVAPRLSLGGVLVFDDIANPHTPELLEVWRRFVAADGGLLAHEYLELGCGVAFAVRMRRGRSVPPRPRMRWWPLGR
jgi:predicted O-methyltransferase YrrM